MAEPSVWSGGALHPKKGHSLRPSAGVEVAWHRGSGLWLRREGEEGSWGGFGLLAACAPQGKDTVAGCWCCTFLLTGLRDLRR